MNQQYHKWFSPRLGRDMELLVFGHAGARVLVFPTSRGRFFDWENRGMMNTWSEHLNNGWLQVYCLDSLDDESWFNGGASAHDRARRHLEYQEYVVGEVLPFSREKNDNPFVISTGASFGAYHAVSIAVRFPEQFNRVLAMSGLYSMQDFTGGQYDETIHYASPIEMVRCAVDEQQLAALRKIDWIFVIGEEDPSYASNAELSRVFWDKGVWHAYRKWSGWAHDWPQWHDMILRYIAGPD